MEEKFSAGYGSVFEEKECWYYRRKFCKSVHAHSIIEIQFPINIYVLVTAFYINNVLNSNPAVQNFLVA